MEKIIGVECWADKLFFERLLNNKKIIRKEKNKNEVLKSITVRSKGNFSIGIVDKDNREIGFYFKENIVERIVKIDDYLEVVKLKNYAHFIIQLKPKEFERWIEVFISLLGKSLEAFGYLNIQEFMKDSKSLPEKLERNQKFQSVMNCVFENLSKFDNHILKTQKILNYLVENKYNADIEKCKGIK